MKIKIGNKVYDSTQVPVLLMFDQGEKELIGSMSPDHMKFCSFPEESDIAEIEELMKFEFEDPNQAFLHIDNDVLIAAHYMGD